MNNQSFEQSNSVYKVGLQTGKLPGGNRRFTEVEKSVINQYWNITCDFIFINLVKFIVKKIIIFIKN